MLRSSVWIGGQPAEVSDRLHFHCFDRNIYPHSPPRRAWLVSRSRSISTQPIRALDRDFQRLELDDGSRSLSFFDRLARAWEILFQPEQSGGSGVGGGFSGAAALARSTASNAEIAKQRLKMILISDRCSITDDAKKKIVTNIVGALADFVEIESEEKVQLNVLADPELGTVYSVTVPVRRVKPEYHEFSKEMGYQTVVSDAVGARAVAIKFEDPSLES